MNIDELDKSRIKVEENSENIKTIVIKVISEFSSDLDGLVREIDLKIRANELDTFTDQELEMYCLKLSSYMYFAASGQELIGLKETISDAIYKENYNNSFAKATGTMADKKASAELSSQDSMLIELVYKHAEKMMESKLVYATHLLSSIKRVLNRRIEQMKMNPIGTKFKATETSIEV